MKKLRFIVFLLAFILLFTTVAYAVSAETLDYGGCNIVYLTVEGHSGSIQNEADRYMIENGYADQDSILLLVDTQAREYYIDTSGRCIQLFPDKTLYRIEDNFLPYLKNNDWNGAGKSFFNSCVSVIKNGDAPVQADTKQTVVQAAVSLIAGILAGGMPLSKAKKDLISVKKKVSAYDYERRNSFALTRSNDTFVNRHVACVPIPRDNNRSGGGFSGSTMHSSGGHSFGGHGGKF